MTVTFEVPEKGDVPQLVKLGVAADTSGLRGEILDAAAADAGSLRFDDPEFKGADDKATMANVLAAAAAYTRVPWIRLPARVIDLGTGSYDMYTGLKVVGAGYPIGAKGEEISSGKSVITKINTWASETNPLFKATTGIYYVTFAGLSFHGLNTTQVFRSTSNVYGGTFANLNFYGCKSAFGSETEKFLMTQVEFCGHWAVIAPAGTQFHLGGSDNALWTSGLLNMNGNPSTAGDGKYLLHLNGFSKSNLGQAYVTCNNGWRGVRISGASAGVAMSGGWYEGMNDSAPCYGNLIRVEGGLVSVRDPWLAYAMSAPDAAEHGAVEVTGGNVLLDRPFYRRKTTVAETVPLVYCSGGKLEVRSAAADTTFNAWTGLPRVQNAGGALVTDSSVTVV